MKKILFVLLVLGGMQLSMGQERMGYEMGFGKVFITPSQVKVTPFNTYFFKYSRILEVLPSGDLTFGAGFLATNTLGAMIYGYYAHNLIEPGNYVLQSVGGLELKLIELSNVYPALKVGISGGWDKLRLNIYYNFPLSSLKTSYTDENLETVTYRYKMHEITFSLMYVIF